MADNVLAQLAALQTAPIGALKQKWRELFETEPPPYNRRFLEHRRPTEFKSCFTVASRPKHSSILVSLRRILPVVKRQIGRKRVIERNVAANEMVILSKAKRLHGIERQTVV
jgi:hypothetical protein